MWRFEYDVHPTLPPLAWVARVAWPAVHVRCGVGVRRTEAGFFEGAWSGPPELDAAAAASTVFGSGIVAKGAELTVVPPSHTLEAIFHGLAPGEGVIFGNSFLAVLVAGHRQLLDDVRYPHIFGQVSRGLSHAGFEIPVAPEVRGPIVAQFHENLVVGRDGTITVSAKTRERPFAGFSDYRDRLVAHVESVFANAEGFRPLATISSGYDSTCSAAIGAYAGCRDAVTFTTGWPWRGYEGVADSGEVAAHALGLDVRCFDRLAYLELDDAPEAEFLVSGMSAEDVIYRSMEEALPGMVVLTGFWGGAAWRGHERPNLSRLDLSGASLTELRLRLGFIHVPVPYIGGLQQDGLARLRDSPEMRPWRVGGRYDEPVARRIAEEAGVARGSFAVEKMATSQKLHADGVAALSESARRSFTAFATPEALAALPTKRPFTRRDRLALKVAANLGRPHLVERTAQRRREAVHFEPTLGALLLRWSVEVMRPRYAALTTSDMDKI